MNFGRKTVDRRKTERSKGMQVFLWITLTVLLIYAVFAFLYTTVIIYASGRATSFLWFWPTTFFIALLAGVFLFFVVTGRLPQLRRAAVCFGIFFWVLFTGFLVMEAVIFSAGRKVPEDDAEYVIILGAQVRGEVPSLVLNARINAAADYLLEHPGATAVASGGKGSGENISEAEAIKRGLMRRGIAEERILLEDRSTSTLENLKFSAEVIAAYEKKVVVVTNDFHIYRAVHLAEKQGYKQVSGLGATEFYAVTIQYYVREFFAVILETLRGTL
ncbi:MAG: YdcF family protein [Lachnospiraceae bacterium]|nr:YdcF family protein [Lachnospiraceae bacterium]